MLAIDFAPSFALPHVAEMPSQWYFPHSLAVNIFGIYSATERTQHNFVYTERTGSKGSNEAISMLNSHLSDTNPESKILTVYVDSYDGHSMISDLMKYLLLLAHMGLFEEVTLKLFVRGHFENASYHSFGLELANREFWSLQEVTEALGTAAERSETIQEDDKKMAPFSDFRTLVQSLYGDIRDMRKFQIFRAAHTELGVIECFEKPSSPGVKVDLRRSEGMSAKRASLLYQKVSKLRKPSVK